jgi:hypothetical protein
VGERAKGAAWRFWIGLVGAFSGHLTFFGIYTYTTIYLIIVRREEAEEDDKLRLRSHR